MTVIYRHRIQGVCYANILWEGRFPMKGGKFPPGHPLSGDGCAGGNAYGNHPKLQEFRARGYYASCFPEGDGITVDPLNDQSREQVVQDIEECFGWTVKEEGLRNANKT